LKVKELERDFRLFDLRHSTFNQDAIAGSFKDQSFCK